MILTRVPEGLLVVRQPDHGTQTGLFAAAWGNEEVPPIDRHGDEVELAARHHDDGWAVWERRPTIDPDTLRPVQFLALTPMEHVPLYRGGIARAAQHGPWVGLLVSMHGAGLYNDRYGTFRLTEQRFSADEQALVDEFLADMERMQDRLLTGVRPVRHVAGEVHQHASDDPEVRDLYLQLQVWDRLSLQYVFRLAGDGAIGPLPRPGLVPGELRCRHDGPFRLALDPYPFADDRLTFPVTSCTVADRDYRSPEDFLEAVARTTPSTLECQARAVST